MKEAEQIAVVARRISGLAEQVVEAHGLGHGPGNLDAPWSKQAQRRAASVYRTYLPESYLEELVAEFIAVARLMNRSACPPDLEDEWFIVACYLRSVADGLFGPKVLDGTDPPGQVEIADTTPAVLWPGELAKLYSEAGARRLAEAGDRVNKALASKEVPLTDAERAWVVRLLEGDTVTRIAADSNMSLRTFNRRLRGLWDRLEVEGRIDGVAKCVERGWL